MTTHEYLHNLNTRFRTGISREHSYRGDLQSLLESLSPGILATNEPARIDCGAPDYIITRKNIPVGFIEAKDIGADLNNKVYKEQFDRYRKSLNNLIITDYLTFQLFREGVFVSSVVIGQIDGGKIITKSENIADFEAMLKSFCSQVGQTIKSSKKLAEMMAGKARLLANVIEKALLPNENFDQVNDSQNNSIREQYHSFQQILIHDITEKGFSDIYAQTIAYGMFAARLHDTSLDNFSRQEAAVLIPKSNPFLRKLFQYVAGYDLDDRIQWIVDDLAEIFRATDVAELLRDFGKSTQQTDPMIHFYETFLSEYDPALRKSRGVWYTPEPVVNFIIRAVDDILKTEFGLAQGLADTSKTKIKTNIQGKKIEQEVHKIQILDPAAGTGTFLAEVVKFIYNQFDGQQGIWNNYVEEHLIPRLNGFEILMASYAMAHLKMDLLLSDTGYKPTRDQRFRIFLTNSLEEHHPDTGTLFANWLSTEANEANHIKRDTPVMVVLGNPPYSGESANKGEWIMNLMEDYKKEPGGMVKLNERNPKWINDDYVKFIRYGQHFIEKNGSGILAFINPHGFLDNPTFRGMRWNLLKTYDKIYTIDLHGNSKKKELSPDGSIDQNVFDIMQGVSINFFVKTEKKKTNDLSRVFYFSLYGKREIKYDFLNHNSIETISYKELPNLPPNYFFAGKDFEEQKVFDKGFALNEMFPLNSIGIVTARDAFTIHDSMDEVRNIIDDFLKVDDETARNKFNLGKDVRDWQVNYARKDLQNSFPGKGTFCKISYRPFDDRWTFYTGKSKGFHCYPRNEVMQHFLKGDNIGLVMPKQVPEQEDSSCFITKFVSAHKLCSAYNINNVFPLYIYPEKATQNGDMETIKRKPNLKPAIINHFGISLNLNFTNEKENTDVTFSPIDILDYIYAVMYCSTYRVKYKEFLKVDFPKIPYPKDSETFWKLVNLGGQMRQIHLLESPTLYKLITTYPKPGSNMVDKIIYENGKVWINAVQYFDLVPQVAWDFYIGGYQPAQKWLKDRKGRELSFEDILHYQKIIVALVETDRLMKEIDAIPIDN